MLQKPRFNFQNKFVVLKIGKELPKHETNVTFCFVLLSLYTAPPGAVSLQNCSQNLQCEIHPGVGDAKRDQIFKGI